MDRMTEYCFAFSTHRQLRKRLLSPNVSERWRQIRGVRRGRRVSEDTFVCKYTGCQRSQQLSPRTHLKAPDPEVPEDAGRNRPRGGDTGRARASADAEEAPPPRAKPASSWPPTGHHLCGATELQLPKLAPEEMEGNTDSASASGSRPEERFRLLLRRLGRRLFFSWQVDATETEKELRYPDLCVRDRGGRLMSLPLSTPVSAAGASVYPETEFTPLRAGKSQSLESRLT